MFNKLKEKLKQGLSIFSKKAEKEADKEIEIKEEIKSEPIKEKVIKEEHKEKIIENERPKEKKKEAVKKQVKITKEEKLEKKAIKEEKKKEYVKEEVFEAKEVEEEKIITEQHPEEKKGFFSRLFHKKEEVKEETKEEKEIKPEIEVKTKEIKEPAEEKSLFGKIKETLTTKTISAEKFEDLFWDLEVILLENSVSVEVIEKIKEDLKEELVEKPLPRDITKKIEETLKSTLERLLSVESEDLLNKIKEKKPFIIALFGINGAGKTTTLAKLGNYFQKQGLKVVFAAGDTFRAAAIQQLEEHADRLKIKIIKHEYGADSAAVAFDAIKYAQSNKIDVVLIDTAGRLHSNVNLMAELKKICKIAKPDLKIFIAEAITGNDAVEQSKKFDENIGIDGIILTKADVDEKGGAIISVSHVTKKPILFLGTGQNYDDLERFDADKIIKRLGLID